MKTKNYVFIFIGYAVIFSMVGFYFYNRPSSHVTTEKPTYEINSNKLLSDYISDEAGADQKYLGKVIEVTGTIMNISSEDKQHEVTLMLNAGEEMAGISCKVNLKSNPEVQKLKTGSEVSVKGICTGMLMDVVLVDCSIQNS